uniref:Putative tripartite motif-containing protein 75 n=1 Tax=Sus scrofa TaxID=9823 RepID=A0A8D0NG11_PIG
MAVAAALAGLQAEAKCPICLDSLHDPVTIQCGHNFCRRCIQRSWAELEDTFPCPMCRHPCLEPHVRSNTQLGRMIEVARLLHSSRSSSKMSQQPHLCEWHNQVLSLFCENDLEVLCPLCAQTPSHQGHVMRSVAEAAADHLQKVSSYVEPLKRQVAETQGLLAMQDIKLLELQEQVQHRQLELASEVRQMSQAMDHEQELVLARLVQEEHNIHEQLVTNIAAFSGHIWELWGLLQEMREQSCSFSPQYSVLQKIAQKFTEDVILDPETAHPNLLVSEDRKSATFMRMRQMVLKAGRFRLEPAVLGSVGFGHGRRYWEVRVDGATWAVGVCMDTAPRARSRHMEGQSCYWTVGQCRGDYQAWGPAGILPLELKEDPCGIGVYLDYELGVISFYNLKDRSHIHSFTDSFSGVLKPYFCVGCDSRPRTLSAVMEHEGASVTLPPFLPEVYGQ